MHVYCGVVLLCNRVDSWLSIEEMQTFAMGEYRLRLEIDAQVSEASHPFCEERCWISRQNTGAHRNAWEPGVPESHESVLFL